MSKHEPLFKIDGKDLYREHNLIIIQVPVFFVCKDDSVHRYLVLLSDFDEDTYVVCPVSNEDLYDMLTGKIVMRQPFINSDKIYFIQAGTVLSEDEVKLVSYDEIEDVLPEKDAMFEIGNNEILRSYSLSLYNNIVFHKMLVKSRVSARVFLEYSKDTIPLANFEDVVKPNALHIKCLPSSQKTKRGIRRGLSLTKQKPKSICVPAHGKSINLIPIRNKK